MKRLLFLLVIVAMSWSCQGVQRKERNTLYMQVSLTPGPTYTTYDGPFHGICPECKRLGLKSQCYESSGFVTLMGYEPFYDEDGKYHVHNPNIHRSYIRCSNSHRFVREEMYRCLATGCEFRGSDRITLVQDTPED